MSSRVETVGSLIVDLRTSSAKFTAEMESAKKSMTGLGTSAGSAQKQLQNFATKGLQSVLPDVAGLDTALGKMMQTATKASGVLGMLGQAGLIVGGIIAVATAVQRLQDEFKNWIQNGELVATTMKRIEDNIKAEQQFMADRQKRLAIETGMRRELLQLQGDEIGLIRMATKEREGKIIADVKDVTQRKKLLEQSAALEQEQLRALREKRDEAMVESMNKQVEVWKTETDKYISELDARVKARQQFEAGLGTGGLGGDSALAGLREAQELRTKIQNEQKQMFFAERDGLLSGAELERERQRVTALTAQQVDLLSQKYAAMPSVLAQIQAAQQQVDPIGWANSMEIAAQWVNANVISLKQMQDGLAAVAVKLTENVPKTEAGTAAVNAATAAYTNLAMSVQNATRALQAYGTQVAG